MTEHDFFVALAEVDTSYVAVSSCLLTSVGRKLLALQNSVSNFLLPGTCFLPECV